MKYWFRLAFGLMMGVVIAVTALGLGFWIFLWIEQVVKVLS